MATDKKADPVTKKIMRIFKNYGLDINSMSDDEFERMKGLYRNKTASELDKDLEASEVFSEEYSENII